MLGPIRSPAPSTAAEAVRGQGPHRGTAVIGDALRARPRDILFSPVKMRHAAHLGGSTHGGHEDPPQLQPAGGADEQHPWRPRGLSLQPAGGADEQGDDGAGCAWPPQQAQQKPRWLHAGRALSWRCPDAGLGLLHRRTEAACVILNFLIATSDGRKTGSQYQSNAKSNI